MSDIICPSNNYLNAGGDISASVMEQLQALKTKLLQAEQDYAAAVAQKEQDRRSFLNCKAKILKLSCLKQRRAYEDSQRMVDQYNGVIVALKEKIFELEDIMESTTNIAELEQKATEAQADVLAAETTLSRLKTELIQAEQQRTAVETGQQPETNKMAIIIVSAVAFILLSGAGILLLKK